MHFEISIVTVTFDFLFCFHGFPFLNFLIKPFWIKAILINFFQKIIRNHLPENRKKRQMKRGTMALLRKKI